MSKLDIYKDLEQRGLLFDSTNPQEVIELLKTRSITLYAGFDPTADSLHVGHMVPLLALRRFQIAGHKPISLAGGATGLIGDPSGKSDERNLLTREVLDYNLSKIRPQLQQFLDFTPGDYQAVLVDNATWGGELKLLDFLRDIGKHFSVNRMIEKDSVRARLEDRESGISYAEFSYMLLQSYDFYYLAEHYNCEMQIGGSDQWGNITAGIDLTRRLLRKDVYGLTLPLITKSDGTKFGKTEKGAVWLGSDRTSPYRFYQFWLNTDDRDVIKFLKFFTFLPLDEIAQFEESLQNRPEQREAQKALANAMTTLVHGQSETDASIKVSQALFGGSLEGLTEAQLDDIASDMPTTSLDQQRFSSGTALVDLLTETQLSPSKSQARKDIESGGVYLNNIREDNVRKTVENDALLFGKFLMLRRGKKNYHMIKVQN
jgi:tyrosyl-tRNA synthetase